MNSGISGISDQNKLKRSPSLFEELCLDLKPTQSPLPNSKNSKQGRKQLNFLSFAYPNDDYDQESEKKIDIFDFFQPADKTDTIRISSISNNLNKNNFNNKKEKISEKWDPYHVIIYQIELL